MTTEQRKPHWWEIPGVVAQKYTTHTCPNCGHTFRGLDDEHTKQVLSAVLKACQDDLPSPPPVGEEG